jgi:hypothetical protein
VSIDEHIYRTTMGVICSALMLVVGSVIYAFTVMAFEDPLDAIVVAIGVVAAIALSWAVGTIVTWAVEP